MRSHKVNTIYLSQNIYLSMRVLVYQCNYTLVNVVSSSAAMSCPNSTVVEQLMVFARILALEKT